MQTHAKTRTHGETEHPDTQTSRSNVRGGASLVKEFASGCWPRSKISCKSLLPQTGHGIESATEGFRCGPFGRMLSGTLRSKFTSVLCKSSRKVKLKVSMKDRQLREKPLKGEDGVADVLEGVNSSEVGALGASPCLGTGVETVEPEPPKSSLAPVMEATVAATFKIL